MANLYESVRDPLLAAAPSGPQEAPEVATHAHVGPDAVIAIEPLPPSSANDRLAGAIVNVHTGDGSDGESSQPGPKPARMKILRRVRFESA